MKICIENMDIWCHRDVLYFKHSDGHLIKIQSRSNDKILEVLQYIRQHESLNDFHSDKVTPEEFSEIAGFLMSNHLLRKEPAIKPIQKLVGFYGDEAIMESLAAMHYADPLRIRFEPIHSVTDIHPCHFIVVASPVFDQYAFLQTLSDEAYKQSKPLLYAEFSPTTFSLGPLVRPSLGSPSLSCYMKRKSVNLRNASLYSEFIQAIDKVKCFEAQVRHYPYFDNSVRFVQKELERYFLYKGALSMHLVGKSVTFDFVQYQIEHSRVLKDPMSPLFQRSTYAPFNG